MDLITNPDPFAAIEPDPEPFEPLEADPEPFEILEPDPEHEEPTDEAGPDGYGPTPDMTQEARHG